VHDRASSRWWAWSGTTLSAPSQTLSALPARPCDPAVRPVPSTDSPALITCRHSPIQAHLPRNGCPSQSPFSGALRSHRLSADWMPIPPITKKKEPPLPSEKKDLFRTSRPPCGGIRARAAGGSHHEIRPQKREREEDRGCHACSQRLRTVIPGSCCELDRRKGAEVARTWSAPQHSRDQEGSFCFVLLSSPVQMCDS
jgi:hypothetical protein